MVVNTHCHVFNLQSVFTSETKTILRARMTDEGFPDAFANAVLLLLDWYLREGGGLNPLAPFSERAQALLNALSIPSVAGGLGSKATAQIEKALGLIPDVLEKDLHGLLGDVFAAFDMDTSYTPQDIVAFLSIALAEKIDAVTDSLMAQMADDDIIVPLMMDITDGQGGDDARFSKHVEDTKGQCLRYPGRILPFYALNPARGDGAKRLKAIVQEGAFVGVKLYPSLGYEIEEVLDICQICDEADFPVIQHCSMNGFFKDQQSKPNSDPNIWHPYLMGGKSVHFERLRVCFGHFGGEEADLVSSLSGNSIRDVSWAAAILAMMKGDGGGSPGCDRVFADLSHHNQARGVSGYFKMLERLLRDELVGGQVLWGTDYFLLQRHVSDANYTRIFRSELDESGLWEKLTKTNPLRFIGLNLANPLGGSAQNLRNHIKFLQRMGPELRLDEAAPWVRPYLK